MSGFAYGKDADFKGFIASGFSSVVAHRDPDADAIDFFPTGPWGGRAGGELVKWIDPRARSAWEPACGAGHMVHALGDYFNRVFASDAYLYDDNRLFDFVEGRDEDAPFTADWIITNPPFSRAEDFARIGYRRARRGVALLCRLSFEETQGRYDLHHGDMPLAVKATFAERLAMVKGRYDPDVSSAAAYAWFVWIKPEVQTPIARLARRVRELSDCALARGIPPGTEERLSRPSDLAFAARRAA